ncbi:macrophage mannose receptor 1-like [Mercenaria mercenaria]|uniref:macrophage mannose receptor 1-like n=1 Tax=Mercenaria mercenaria TaxID=6596 RepID=UPI00234F59CE|nr:macrophage mannose receptor 1-like [Mercenaria mercenaria]
MTVLFAFLALFSLFVHSEATRCFECRNVPYPRDCAKVRTCNSDEYCSTEQIVTTSGNIVYNTGCLSKSKCSTVSGLLVGKRSTVIQRSSSDLSTCIECCTGDFCNNQGCGTQTAPLGQRGPYCFNCDSILDPKACSDVAVCEVDEKCMLYSPAEFSGLPEVVYRSQCETKVACDILSQAASNYACPPSCCDSDFCNDQCGLPFNNSMTTPLPRTTTFHIPTQPAAHITTQQPVVVTSQVACKLNHYYDDLTGMCIKIDETRKLNHTEALKACGAIGDQLVTIDTHEKTVFVENMILRHSDLSESGQNYLIGAFDKHDNSEFYWPNGHKMYYTNWGGGDEVAHNQQPDDRKSNPQNCVILYGKDHYRWHDDKCENEAHFICEDRSTLKLNIVHQTGATDSANIPLPTEGSNTFHCNAHGGYIHLQREGTHLCVHIVTHHANWDNARSACKKEGGDLVVLDTTSKAKLMRGKVGHSYSSQMGYWIGAKDFHSHNLFSWVNGQPVTDGDWYPGQPNHHDGGHDQNCACMWSSGEHFHWHDDYCPKGLGYICERK